MKIICHFRGPHDTLIWFASNSTGCTAKAWVSNEESYSLISLSLPAIEVADEDSGDNLAEQFESLFTLKHLKNNQK